LTILIALRAIGVSAKRRRFYGVGLGNVISRPACVVSTLGRGTVRRLGAARARIASNKKADTFVSAMRRKAPFHASMNLMMSF